MCFTNVQVSALSRRSAWISARIYHSSSCSHKIHLPAVGDSSRRRARLSSLIFSRFVFHFYLHFSRSTDMHHLFSFEMSSSCVHVQHGDLHDRRRVYARASPALISIVGITSSVLMGTSYAYGHSDKSRWSLTIVPLSHLHLSRTNERTRLMWTQQITEREKEIGRASVKRPIEIERTRKRKGERERERSEGEYIELFILDLPVHYSQQ